MHRSADGEEAAFDALLARHRQWVLRLVYRFVGDATEAEDLAQVVFLRLYQARERYKPTAQFSTFLYRLVANVCLNENRRRRRRETCPLDNAAEVATPSSEAPDALWAQKELEARVREALERLPDRQRMALVLSRYEGLSNREVAKAVNCSEGAVELLLHRAKQQLRKQLEDYIEGQG